MASGRGFVMAKFYEASAYRNTPRLSTPSLDEVAWAIFCGYFVPLQAALSSFIFTIIVHLVECILVHNHGGWLSSSLSLWFLNSGTGLVHRGVAYQLLFSAYSLIGTFVSRLQSCHQGKGFLPRMLNPFCALHVDHFGSRSPSKHVGSRCLNARKSRL